MTNREEIGGSRIRLFARVPGQVLAATATAASSSSSAAATTRHVDWEAGVWCCRIEVQGDDDGGGIFGRRGVQWWSTSGIGAAGYVPRTHRIWQFVDFRVERQFSIDLIIKFRDS